MAADGGQDQVVDLSGLGSFDFAPSWAAGDKVVSSASRGGSDSRDDERPSRDRRPPRRFDDAKPSGGGDRFQSRDRGGEERIRKPFGFN